MTLNDCIDPCSRSTIQRSGTGDSPLINGSFLVDHPSTMNQSVVFPAQGMKCRKLVHVKERPASRVMNRMDGSMTSGKGTSLIARQLKETSNSSRKLTGRLFSLRPPIGGSNGKRLPGETLPQLGIVVMLLDLDRPVQLGFGRPIENDLGSFR